MHKSKDFSSLKTGAALFIFRKFNGKTHAYSPFPHSCPTKIPSE
jgi:hypothetical protein